MENPAYKKQVALLLNVLPEVAKENCFALHGGTAINLFVRDMPRLSVDIDLTYLPIEDRNTSLANIAKALERIKANIEKVVPGARVNHKEEIGKLLISAQGNTIKLEVNPVKRGVIGNTARMPLCNKAQEEFDVFCAIDLVPLGQLYGGKICAALDRQHPRDIFDVKYLMANEGFSEAVKTGFLFSLLSSDRPLNEILSPNYLDQRLAMENQFAGMSKEEFSYEEYEAVRETLVSTIHASLTKEDKEFLLNFKNRTPDWSRYDFQNFPAISWKLQNLQTLKERNPDKHQKMYTTLQALLSSF